MNRRRLQALERLFGSEESEPSLQDVVGDYRRLDQWLTSLGMTARQALAAGLTAPAELRLRWASLAKMVEAQDRVDAFRREVLSQQQRTNPLVPAQEQAEDFCPDRAS